MTDLNNRGYCVLFLIRKTKLKTKLKNKIDYHKTKRHENKHNHENKHENKTIICKYIFMNFDLLDIVSNKPEIKQNNILIVIYCQLLLVVVNY